MKAPRVHPVTLGALIALGLVALLCLAVAVCSTGAFAAHAKGLPEPQPLIYPAVCEVPYTLQSGERAVLLCIAPVPRGGLEGLAQIASGHEAVDATLVRRVGLGRLVFAVANRSTDPVTATARGEQW